ncbi:Lrp/AsnC ligand binding domain-containing protein [Chryseobacterium sp. Bi04]|uniref:Lrp/AsnC family transcriptional regulator n=1 Tax=Chryseobacterium sp. Bi04 TaxID=2822345 RepID=UPI001DC33963|nr:Lrp/AsnC ligand binding domain-containing protein [Chryseobacterium sp. Bi04]CAH0194508.1 Regulatory protein AsnC [Chryseobacterium sp. Bi04]
MKKKEQFNYCLDSIDKQIIYMLTDHTKTSVVHIANNLKISPRAIQNKIKKLEEAQVIDCSTTQLNSKKISYDHISFIGVSLDQRISHSDLLKSLYEINEVVEAHFTTGNYNFFLKVICKDNNHLLQILEKLQKLDLKTEIFIALKQAIYR